MRGRLYSIQALRGLAVSAVLLFHLRHISGFLSDRIAFPAFWVHLQAGVDLFFVISGYVMVYTSIRPGLPPASPLGFLRRRAMRIYPLYWLVTFAIILAVAVAPRIPLLRSPLSAGRVLASVLLWPQSSTPILGQGWSLVHEMYFYLVFALLLAVAARRPARALGVWGLIVLAGNLILGPFSNQSEPLLRTWFHPLTFEFIAGAFLALAHGRKWFPGLRTAFVASGAIAAIILWQPEFPQHGWVRALAYGSVAALLVHGLVGAERSGRKLRFGPMEPIGDASYSIYLVQMGLLVALMRVFHAFISQNVELTVPWALLSFSGLAALCGGIASWRWLERPLQRALRRGPRPDSVNAEG